MPSKGTKEKEEIPFVALLRVSWPGDYQVVRTFDRAWHYAMEMSEVWRPVKIEFLRFVRKDS